MDANAQITTKIAATPQTGVTAKAQAGNGVFSNIAGMNFIDLIFAQISEGKDLKNDNAGQSLIATPIATTVTPTPSPLEASSLIADSDELSITDILGQLMDLNTDSTTTLAPEFTNLNAESDVSADLGLAPGPGLDKLRSYLDSLLNGLPAEQKPQIVQVTPGEFKQILVSLKADLNAGNPSLIATGLTPQNLTTLVAQIETAEKNGTLDMTAMVKIVPPDAATTDKPALFLPRALVAIQEQAQTGDDNPISDSDADTLATALNKLVVGGTAPEHSAKKAVVDTLSLIPGGVSGDENADTNMRSLDISGKVDVKTTPADGKNIPSGVEKAAEKIKSMISAGLSTIMNMAPGSVETSANWQDVFPEGMDSLTVGLNGKPMSIGSTATMTSLTTAAPQATYPHPATQAVAANITKAAAAGEDKAFTIKLDPPELGRVEVKMMIDKHNAVKAHLVIEKPETYMMLQRDAQILERSLQGIGLDAGNGGLSFELAQDNMFQNEGDRGGEGYQAGRKAAGSDSAETVIETTMSWQVDPRTGLQHYNVLV